jgi:hypothetical protein
MNKGRQILKKGRIRHFAGTSRDILQIGISIQVAVIS